MSISSRRPSTGPPSSQQQAEIALLPSLKSCLLNLPPSLVSLLLNANALTQNVIVELQFRPADPKTGKPAATPKSVYFGWTGMQSQTKLAGVLGKDGVRGAGAEKEIPIVEIDTQVARLVGLEGGVRVGVELHLDPPMAHTINIEPVTATDWEIIELHARFLETNFLNQIRALPNPLAGSAHPLTLHLTPTSTANILVTSLTPTPSSSQAFVKISPDAEVIVAPKTRQAARSSSGRDNRSVASTGRKSAGGRSTTSVTRHRSMHEEEKARPPLFLRGVTRALENEWFEDGGDEMRNEGLRIWLDREHLLSKTLRGVSWVIVTVVRPAGLQEPVDPQSQPSPEQTSASKIVARLCIWEDAPDARHVVLSSLLCATLVSEGLVGAIIRIDPAPTPLPKTASALKEPSQQASKDAIIKRLRITPFASESAKKAPGFKFGGESKTERDEASRRIKSLFGKSLLEGPVTDGMMLPAQGTWPGGILDFEPPPPGGSSRTKTNWLVGADRKLDIFVQPETALPKFAKPPGEPLPEKTPVMVGIDALTGQTKRSLLHTSSVLLTGGLGSGKTSLVQVLAHQLRNEYLFHAIYFPCRTLVTDETRIKTIKETLHRVFATAAWGARLGGRALVILDDLDRICPVETELQVDANGRSRQVSELLCTLVRQFCSRDSGVVLLATAQGKEAISNVVIGGHVVRDIVALKAPSKDGRRQVLEMLVKKAGERPEAESLIGSNTASAWMEESVSSRPTSSNGPIDGPEAELRADYELDLLDIAGHTDGYMPGDLTLLVSRARSEALIRVVSDTVESAEVTLTSDDFEAALKGFTPASLRGVTLHSSTTTFSSIGGLRETRQTLLETLQYPTTYAPLFAQCPLRLRSGLLLFGYPGCGKTLLASAVAGECGLNFISVKGPEILNKYIGASEKSVRDLFERAEAAKPCVLFFDEFDSIAPKRGHDSTGVTDRVVNMLLTMMDGAEGLSGVYVLAATSRPDLIDPALLRPGRLDKSLICDMPDEEDRLDILRAVSAKLKVDDDVLNGEDLEIIAQQTDGYSGADLQAVMYNAHLEAIQDVLGSENTAAQDFEKRKDSNTGTSKGGKGIHEFTYFRLGDAPSSSNDTPSLTPAAVAAERAQIAAKLSAMSLARRKAKQARHQSQQQAQRSPVTALNGEGNGEEQQRQQQQVEPLITARHLRKSLESTRSSISAQERRRLEKIYREFVVGRNGEMSDGQGGSEIGGRSSLM